MEVRTYPCFKCNEKGSCKGDCEKRRAYLKIRKENIMHNKKWAKESVILGKGEAELDSANKYHGKH